MNPADDPEKEGRSARYVVKLYFLKVRFFILARRDEEEETRARPGDDDADASAFAFSPVQSLILSLHRHDRVVETPVVARASPSAALTRSVDRSAETERNAWSARVGARLSSSANAPKNVSKKFPSSFFPPRPRSDPNRWARPRVSRHVRRGDRAARRTGHCERAGRVLSKKEGGRSYPAFAKRSRDDSTTVFYVCFRLIVHTSKMCDCIAVPCGTATCVAMSWLARQMSGSNRLAMAVPSADDYAVPGFDSPRLGRRPAPLRATDLRAFERTSTRCRRSRRAVPSRSRRAPP